MSEEYEKFLNKEIVGATGKNYTISKYLNQGGNGFVFVCINKTSALFVVKILHTANEEKINNFKKEIELQKSLNSDYIVKCVDSGEIKLTKTSKPRPFYIMKKYDCSLEDLLNDGKITPLDAFKYSIQLCKALKKMHKKKEPLIHRDLKPENILFDNDKRKVLICDFGLTHIENGNKTINDKFKGNVDYHAPEQKKRGCKDVGTYTDIYSLGLIINVMFTKEIAQGESYKKIWECAPHFYFIDAIVDRMIQHDIEKREHDINVIIKELEEHELEYEVEESFLKNMYKDSNMPSAKTGELMNLLSIAEYMFTNDIKGGIPNINYYCDYHFECNELMINSLLILSIYDAVMRKFNYESNCYKDGDIPYNPLDISNENDKKLFDSLVEFIDARKIYYDLNYVKGRIKKYFLSIANHHAQELLNDFKRYEIEVNEHCTDTPIIYCVLYVKDKLSIVERSNIRPSNFLKLIKYEESEVLEKNQLFFNKYTYYYKLLELIKGKIDGVSHIIKNEKLEIFFELPSQEILFENFLRNIQNTFSISDVRRDDIQDIIDNADGMSLQKNYLIDLSDAKVILENYSTSS